MRRWGAYLKLVALEDELPVGQVGGEALAEEADEEVVRVEAFLAHDRTEEASLARLFATAVEKEDSLVCQNLTESGGRAQDASGPK